MKGLDPLTRVDTSALSSLGFGINVKSPAYGAVGDGVVNDGPAMQAAIDAAIALGSATVFFPAGTYNTSTALALIEVKGINFLGEGPDNTKIVATGSNAAVQCNGIWRSHFQGIMFKAGAARTGAVFELDGNYDGTHHQGVQGNNFTDCYFDGANLADYAFAICRQGAGSGQGSENIFINTGFIAATTLVLIRGGNALNNLFLGGNLQDFITGFLLENGLMSLYRVAFQSTRGYAQIAAGGADIDTSYGSVGGQIIDDASDSESLVHLKAINGTPAIIRGLSQRAGAFTLWAAAGVYTSNQFIIKNSVSLGSKLYRVTTAGTAGGTEPTWPDTGTVSDGSVVWTETEYDNIISGGGTIDWRTCSIAVPGIVRISEIRDQTVVSVNANYSVPNKGDYLILADTTSGSITITLPIWDAYPNRIQPGQKITIKKTDTSANTVTIVQSDGGNPEGAATVIPGGSKGYIQFGYGPAVGASEMWWYTSKSFGVIASSLTATVTSNFFKGADVASAATITPTGNLFHVTGTTNITSVSGTGITAGTEITIIFDGILTFTDGSNLKLAGNFVTATDGTITIKFDGTNWFEICRSVN